MLRIKTFFKKMLSSKEIILREENLFLVFHALMTNKISTVLFRFIVIIGVISVYSHHLFRDFFVNVVFIGLTIPLYPIDGGPFEILGRKLLSKNDLYGESSRFKRMFFKKSMNLVFPNSVSFIFLYIYFFIILGVTVLFSFGNVLFMLYAEYTWFVMALLVLVLIQLRVRCVHHGDTVFMVRYEHFSWKEGLQAFFVNWFHFLLVFWDAGVLVVNIVRFLMSLMKRHQKPSTYLFLRAVTPVEFRFTVPEDNPSAEPSVVIKTNPVFLAYIGRLFPFYVLLCWYLYSTYGFLFQQVFLFSGLADAWMLLTFIVSPLIFVLLGVLSYRVQFASDQAWFVLALDLVDVTDPGELRKYFTFHGFPREKKSGDESNDNA